MIIGESIILSGGGESATIIVHAPTGSTITMSHGGKTTTGTEVSGTWTFKAKEYGTYTLTATKGGQTATKTVAVVSATQYELTMSYDITVSISGHESLSSWTQYGIDAYVVHGGVNHTNTFSIPAGDEITLKVTYMNSSSEKFKIILNGVGVGSVVSNTRSYTFTPVSDVNVVISLDTSGGAGGGTVTLTATGGV